MAMRWRGSVVAAKVVAATRLAIDETTTAMVRDAKANHPWHNRIGTLEGSIQMRPAEVELDDIVGVFGSFQVEYALYLELDEQWTFLRPAFDAEAPKLKARIAAKTAGL